MLPPLEGKLSKSEHARLTLELEPTEDVLAGLAARRREGQTLVGFAAEHGGGAVERAREKLERKRLDAIVCNDVSQPGIGFDARRNAVTIVTAAGSQVLAEAAKRSIAEAVLDAVDSLRR
jgi:phosphopantothenoylcysteine decarboxylase / phosphopantothenate---cysteine ligase